MAQKHELTLFLCIFVVLGYSVSASNRDKEVEILSEFETIVETNDNYTVFCQGNKPLKWTVPQVTDNTRFWTTFTTEFETPIDKKFQYGSRLNIINMTYPFVGFYYCHHIDADTLSETKSARIYLYVNDDEHLSPLEGGDTIETIVVTQNEEALIPCKPTSPDVKVSLTLLSGEVVPLNVVNRVSTLYRYEPMYGFFTNDTKEKNKDVIFDCQFAKDDKSHFAWIHMLVEIPVTHLAKPEVKDKSEGHTTVGNPLILECIIKTSNTININWITPNGQVDSTRMNTSRQIRSGEKQSRSLTIFNTTMEDEGVYTCNVSDTQNHSSSSDRHVKIFGLDEYYLNISEPNKVYSIIAEAGQISVQWSVDVQGHPVPTVTWLNNRNEPIPLGNGTKYETTFISNIAFLRIKHIAITDFGNYTLLASNNKTERSRSFFLNVTDKPSVRLESHPFHLIDTLSTIKCYAYAYPEPEFEWQYKACQTQECAYSPITGTVTKSDGFEFISEVTVKASESGLVKCLARNYRGFDEATTGFYVTDIKNGFDIFGIDSTIIVNKEKSNAIVAIGDKISVTCGASLYNYSDIHWLFNNQILENNERYNLTENQTRYSTMLKLEISQVNSSINGLYSCRIAEMNGAYLYKNISFLAADSQPPSIKSNMSGVLEKVIPDTLVLSCQVSGIPKPTVTWYKNGLLFDPSKSKRILVSGNNEQITFPRTEATDEGSYECMARNKVGDASRKQEVKFTNLPRNQKWLIYVIIFLSLLFIFAIVYICIKLRKEKQLQRELTKLGLANFAKGAVENINPELGIDDQAELLPYDQKWEFPIEHLKLGKQLGSGAFGVVMKGEAKNIVESEPITTVAVKMVKKNADNTYIRALASELKIMVHLGKHLNVVNLLGACTKNVAKRELLVIVEYCRFGNLQNYLLRHRDNYIDQVNPKTGKIDYLIGQEYFDRTYSVSSDRSNTQSPLLKYAALTFSNSSNHPVLPPPNNMGDYRANTNSGSSATTEMSTIPQEEGIILSNNSVQPEWRSNYKGDYKGNVKPICTKDLLAWTFQVARGMEYLASRKVLHGDLAARNILLADNNIVKICDFGLAKSMYKNDNYKKRGDGPLPVKWMAIESIRDRIFSTQSDVWSFGIVLWEFFSLARTPYPGMQADERLFQKLVEGYRMDSPEYAPKEIYRMMTDCWASIPQARPSFTKLTERIGTMLEDSLRKHYIDLNDPYLMMNTQRLEDGHSDYLAMLSPPTFEALSTPQYVNESVGQESLEDSGYLSMKPSIIFSPRADEGKVFDFNVSNRKHLNSEDGNGPELLPMLHRPSESDCETPLQSPTSYSNPSYLIPPKIIEEPSEENIKTNKDILKSSDNYVNMPQNKSIIKEKINSTNNPFVNVNSDKGDAHYVNGNTRNWESIPV